MKKQEVDTSSINICTFCPLRPYINIKLQIWDLAGGKQFILLAPIYSQSADGFIFVYDATSRASFDGLNEWITKIEANCPDNISRVVVAAKGDLKDDRQVTKDEGQAYAT